MSKRNRSPGAVTNRPRSDVPAPYGWKPILTYKVVNTYLAFITNEVDSDWHRRPRPAGRYVARACVPGNLLAEGTIVVTTSIATVDPVRVHLHEADAVAFQVVDTLAGDSARGDYGGAIPGAVRPLLRWETEFTPLEAAADTRLPAPAKS